MKRLFFTAIGITMILVLIGCSTMMTVNATDAHGTPIVGAHVIVDGQHIGQTPGASTSVSNGLWSTTRISVTADGYHPQNFTARRELKVGPLIGGLFVWPFLLWVWGPSSEQHTVLTPLAPTPAPAAAE